MDSSELDSHWMVVSPDRNVNRTTAAPLRVLLIWSNRESASSARDWILGATELWLIRQTDFGTRVRQ